MPTSRVIASELGSDFVQAADSRIVAATDDTRKAVKDYLESQITKCEIYVMNCDIS